MRCDNLLTSGNRNFPCNDVDKGMPAAADTVEHVMEEIGVTPLSNTFRVGRFSLDMKDRHGVGLSYELSARTFI